MDEAQRRLRIVAPGWGVIASTDGDTQVDPRWIAANLAEIDGGAEAVGGRIVTDWRGCDERERTALPHNLREVGYRLLLAEMEAFLDQI